MTKNGKDKTQAFNKLIDYGVLLVNTFEKTFLEDKISVPPDFVNDFKTSLATMSVTVNNMGDQINIANSQVSSVGSHSTSQNNQFHQQNNLQGENLKDDIAKVLETLRKELSENSNSGKNIEMMAKVTNAEAALKNNKSSAIKLLKPILKWMTKTGKTIGVELIKQYIDHHLGIK